MGGERWRSFHKEEQAWEEAPIRDVSGGLCYAMDSRLLDSEPSTDVTFDDGQTPSCVTLSTRTLAEPSYRQLFQEEENVDLLKVHTASLADRVSTVPFDALPEPQETSAVTQYPNRAATSLKPGAFFSFPPSGNITIAETFDACLEALRGVVSKYQRE